jgi:hypothetical protein
LGHAVGEIGVTELGEGVVAHRQLASGVALVARGGEVPGEVEILTADAGLPQPLEDFLEVAAACIDLRLLGRHPVAVVAEGGGRFDPVPGGIAQPAQGDYVAVPRGEVDCRVDLQRRLGGIRGGRVDLDPDRPAPAGFGVDHDDGGVAFTIAADVVDRGRAGRRDVGGGFDPGNLEQDRRALAEAVGGVVGVGGDVGAEHVGRHPCGFEVDVAPGRAARIGSRVVVVGEGQHAERVARFGDEVAVGRVRHVDRRQPVWLAMRVMRRAMGMVRPAMRVAARVRVRRRLGDRNSAQDSRKYQDGRGGQADQANPHRCPSEARRSAPCRPRQLETCRTSFPRPSYPEATRPNAPLG